MEPCSFLAKNERIAAAVATGIIQIIISLTIREDNLAALAFTLLRVCQLSVDVTILLFDVKMILTWSTTLTIKKVKSVDNVTNLEIISLFMKYPRKLMVSLNRASVQIAVIKMEA